MFTDLTLKLYYICITDYKMLRLSLYYLPWKIFFEGIRSVARRVSQKKKRSYQRRNPDPKTETFRNIRLVKNFSTEEKEL